MRIIREETPVLVDGIGEVAFEPFQRAGAYWREHHGQTHTQQFRFTAGGRAYWGSIVRTYDRRAAPGSRTDISVEIRTQSGKHSRALGDHQKADWRRALRAQFRQHLEAFLTEQENRYAK